LALGALPAAARFFEAALEHWPADDEQRPDLLLAYARSRVDDVALEDTVLSEAIEGLLRAGKVEAAAEAQARLAGVWLNRGDRGRRPLTRGGLCSGEPDLDYRGGVRRPPPRRRTARAEP